MMDRQVSTVVFTEDAKRFLKRTGVAVIAIEVVVLGAVWFFQTWFGR